MTPEEMKRFFRQGIANTKLKGSMSEKEVEMMKQSIPKDNSISDLKKSLLNRTKKMTGSISEAELELFKRLIPKSK
tara:strand:+ start:412 stop:639 length:228 start_codon:yes stop_codon:yes gene_type:complete